MFDIENIRKQRAVLLAKIRNETSSKLEKSNGFTIESKGGGYYQFFLNGEPHVVDGEQLQVKGKADAEAKLAELNGGK